jgi:hypothetical protein
LPLLRPDILTGLTRIGRFRLILDLKHDRFPTGQQADVARLLVLDDFQYEFSVHQPRH